MIFPASHPAIRPIRIHQSSAKITSPPANAAVTGKSTGKERLGKPAQLVCLNESMFARKIRVQYEEAGAVHAWPLRWLDSFRSRDFTNASVFDDTLTTRRRTIESRANGPIEELRNSMEDWFRRKSYLPKNAKLVIGECRSS